MAVADILNFRQNFEKNVSKMYQSGSFSNLTQIFKDANYERLDVFNMEIFDNNLEIESCSMSFEMPEYREGETLYHVDTKGNFLQTYIWTPPMKINGEYVGIYNQNAMGTVYWCHLTVHENYDLDQTQVDQVKDTLIINTPITDKGRLNHALWSFKQSAKETAQRPFFGHELFGKPMNPEYMA